MGTQKVIVVMGSESDLEAMSAAIEQLGRFGIAADVHILSAHRSPDAVTELVETLGEDDVLAIIAGAGRAAHLPGVIAAKTIVPVIGVPMETPMAGGLDSLLSMAQMPAGVPVATMGTGRSGAVNAAVLAAQILARSDPDFRQKLVHYKDELASKVARSSNELRSRLGLK